MKKKKITKHAIAIKMNTSRSQLDRILDPENEHIQFDTIIKAASVLGRKVHIELV